MESAGNSGLSEGNRTYIITLVFVGLLLFGPAPDAIEMRYLYLVAVPTAAWAMLRYAGRRLQIDDEANDRTRRALTAVLAGMFVMGAIDQSNVPNHLVCTREIGDGFGGKECIGEDVPVSGPDLGNVTMLIVAACACFWSAVKSRSD